MTARYTAAIFIFTYLVGLVIQYANWYLGLFAAKCENICL